MSEYSGDSGDSGDSRDSRDSRDSDPFAHPNYGRVVITAGVGMGMLTSEILPGHEPVIKVARSLYDKNHCGGCNASRDDTVENWKDKHINENIECRRAYQDKTCQFERYASEIRPDPIYQPQDYIPPSETPPPQHPGPQFQTQQFHPQLQHPAPQFQTQQAHSHVTPYPPSTQPQTQAVEAYAIPNSPQYAEGRQSQQPALDAYRANHPPEWLEATANTSQPGQQHNPQQMTEIYDPSYAGNVSSKLASPDADFPSNT
ncbi:hypothetical protein EAF04_007903 [Stromatinia cepivora]|nr:hypothetical protein EAF04_007903 [Stromatinia cepivora]